jgi:hypothetical protein
MLFITNARAVLTLVTDTGPSALPSAACKPVSTSSKPAPDRFGTGLRRSQVLTPTNCLKPVSYVASSWTRTNLKAVFAELNEQYLWVSTAVSVWSLRETAVGHVPEKSRIVPVPTKYCLLQSIPMLAKMTTLTKEYHPRLRRTKTLSAARMEDQREYEKSGAPRDSMVSAFLKANVDHGMRVGGQAAVY